MVTWMLAVLVVLLGAAPAFGHFLWIVPESNGRLARVIISETLAVDTRVDIAVVERAALVWRDREGHDVPLTLTPAGRVFTVPVRASRGVLHGHADLGTRPSGERVYRLHYYPKTIVGDPFSPGPLGHWPIEIVPIGEPGAVRLKVLVNGAPAPDVDVNVVLPDGSDDILQTGPDGATGPMPWRGRVGAWARHWEPTAGSFDHQPFDHTRHYTMLVFDTEGASRERRTDRAPSLTRATPLPEGTSSFGAVASHGWLYVYGGHIVRTHQYSTEAVSGRFHRLNLDDLKTWESLPGGPPLQGMNLVAYRGTVYRVGGMQPLNTPGAPEMTVSVADVAKFNPDVGQWDAMPPLPTPRSSHDVVRVGHQLFVIGGWTLRGREKPVWPSTIDVLDLSARTPAWRSLPQPFQRRAFIAAAHDDKVYVLGGFDEHDRVLRDVRVYDVARGTWSQGPDLPGGSKSGFAPAAIVHRGDLYLSIDDGGLYRLERDGRRWQRVATATPRIVHRLASAGDSVLVIGGAFKGANVDLVERIVLR